MAHTTKVWLTTGAGLVILGLLIFAAVMMHNHWDFSKLSTVKYVTNTYPVTEGFTDIWIKTNTADIQILPSDSESCQVICHEEENALHTVSVEDGCLTVRLRENQKWYAHIGINIGSPRLTVTLPRAVYQSVTVEGSTGNVLVEKLSAENADIRVSTGHVTLSELTCSGSLRVDVSTGRTDLNHVSCGTFTSTGSTGSVKLSDVTAEQQLFLRRNTGDVKLDRCDAGELMLQTNTGDVTGTLRSDKMFVAQTSTGHIDVPKTAGGGRCQISTSTGDIHISILE